MSTPISQAAAAMGGASALARRIGITPGAVSQMVAGTRATPPDRCPAIERATSGRVTCELLRPDVAWVRVPDHDWPWHPDGRPLIDVTRPAAAANDEQSGVAHAANSALLPDRTPSGAPGGIPLSGDVGGVCDAA